MGLKGLASCIPYTQAELREELFYIGNVRNRFCHNRPWFESSYERERFTRAVEFVNDAFRIENWCQHPDTKAKFGVPPPNLHRTASLGKRGTIDTPIQPQNTLPAPATGLHKSQSIYVVPKDASADLKRKIEEAEVFAQSQRHIITTSQQQLDEEIGEVIDDDTWACKDCGFNNDADFIVCAICGTGEAPGHWTCPMCIQVNFDQEVACSLCQTLKSVALAKAKEAGWVDQSEDVVSSAPVKGQETKNSNTSAKSQGTRSLDASAKGQEMKRSRASTKGQEDEEHNSKNAKKRKSSSSIGLVPDVSAVLTSMQNIVNQEAKRKKQGGSIEEKHRSDSIASRVVSDGEATSAKLSAAVSASSPMSKPPKSPPLETSSLSGWEFDVKESAEGTRVYRNVHSHVLQMIAWPLPEGWKLVLSSSKPDERLCFQRGNIRQSVYPQPNTPDGWVEVGYGISRKTFRRTGGNNGARAQFETAWPLPNGWILAESKSRPNRLCYLRLEDGYKTFQFPGLTESQVSYSG